MLTAVLCHRMHTDGLDGRFAFGEIMSQKDLRACRTSAKLSDGLQKGKEKTLSLETGK